MEDKLRKISEALQNIAENEVTKTVLIPLFKKMGFFKVEYYGGTDEEGKDLLLWEKNNFGDLKLTVAQVKHFKFSNSAGNSQSLQTIVNQLITCFTKSLSYSDKTIHMPHEAILISTKEIDSKNIKSRFGDNPNLTDKKIRIIDGLELAELLLKNCPKLVSTLIDEEIDFTFYTSETLDNRILLKALSFDKKKAIKNIFTDIDFSLGKSSTKLFFNNEFEGYDRHYNLDSTDWENFKIQFLKLDNEIIKWLFEQSIDEIEELYTEELEEYEKWYTEFELLRNNEQDNRKVFEVLSNKHHRDKTSFLEKSRELNKQERRENKVATDLLRIKKLRADIKNLEKAIEPLTDFEMALISHEQEMRLHESREPELKYRFDIKGKKLGEWLHEQKSKIKEKLNLFNSKEPSEDELKNYLRHCSYVFLNSSVLLETREFSECLNLDKDIVRRVNFESTRFKLSIDKVFDTGMNLTILGQAGGGKTTNLQMYALNHKSRIDKTIIWAPLAQVVTYWKQNHSETKIEYKIQNLDIAICEYLRHQGVEISNDNFINTLHSKAVVVLFDGLDEAMRSNEWLPDGINFIADKYSKFLQVIVTSRMSGPFVERLNFFTITLLPFTKEQRNQFIEKWFEDKDSEIKEKITSHFAKNQSIDEITRNPLLTTTLCVLAKHELPLPQTEINLYNDRLKLLTGYYDNVKNIKTRISTTPHNLEFLAKKLAYYLHNKNKREESVENLEIISVSILKNKLSEKLAKAAFKELIDPCNIIVPMSETGKYGFGHLRYQEHLAAMELVSNRNINILSLLGGKLHWWRECLYFFAEMSDDLTWLITSLGHQIHNTRYSEILEELIKLRPEEEIESIGLLFDKYEDDIGYFIEDDSNDIY